jgi:hypothetical protein
MGLGGVGRLLTAKLSKKKYVSIKVSAKITNQK